MNEQDNAATVQQAYHNFKTGNMQGLLDQMAENVTWELPEIKDVPVAGKRTGRDGVKDFFTTLARDQEVLEFEPLESLAQGDKVFHSVITNGGLKTLAENSPATLFISLRCAMARSPASGSTLIPRFWPRLIEKR